MTELRVFVVIRLATDEDYVVDFYNQVDDEFELDLEVLDDIEGEANEILRKGNSWITYSPLLHKLRESGTFMKLFDLLDERSFTPVEVATFSQLLLHDGEAPSPCNLEEFVLFAGSRLRSVPCVYDPLHKRMAPLVRMEQLRRALAPALPKKIEKTLTASDFMSSLLASLQVFNLATTCGSSKSCGGKLHRADEIQFEGRQAHISLKMHGPQEMHFSGRDVCV